MKPPDENRLTRGNATIRQVQGGAIKLSTSKGAGNQRVTNVYGRGQNELQRKPRQIVDLRVCLDATESMVPFLYAMVCNCTHLIDQLVTAELDAQVGAVIFWDELYGERPELYPIGTPPEKLKTVFARTEARGGGDLPESALPAIDKALSLPGYRPNAMKVLLLITDAPPHDPEAGLTSSSVLERLKREQVLTFCCTPPITPYIEMASATRGELFPIQPDMSPDAFRSILDSLAHTTKVTARMRDDGRVLAEAREAIRRTEVYRR